MEVFLDLNDPEDVKKYLFAEDIISYFMHQHGFTPNFRKVIPEQNRRMMPRAFGHVIQIAASFLYRRISAYNTFQSFQTLKMISMGTFLLFAQHLEFRYFPNGYNPQKFLYFCSHLAYMATCFYKNGANDISNLAVNCIVKVMKGYKTTEPEFWNGLNTAAFRFLKIAFECGFAKMSVLDSLKIQFVVNLSIKHKRFDDTGKMEEDAATNFKKGNDLLKLSAEMQTELSVKDDNLVHSPKLQSKDENESCLVLHKENLNDESLLKNCTEAQINETHFEQTENSKLNGGILSESIGRDDAIVTDQSRKIVQDKEITFLKGIKDLMNKKWMKTSRKTNRQTNCPIMHDKNFDVRLNDLMEKFSDRNYEVENDKISDNFTHDNKNISFIKNSIDENDCETVNSISHNDCLDDKFEILKCCNKYRDENSKNKLEKFELDVNPTKNENKEKSIDQRSILKEINNNECLINSDNVTIIKDLEIQTKESEHSFIFKKTSLDVDIVKENSLETSVSYEMKNETNHAAFCEVLDTEGNEILKSTGNTTENHCRKVFPNTVSDNENEENKLMYLNKSSVSKSDKNVIDQSNFVNPRLPAENTVKRKRQILSNIQESAVSHQANDVKSFDKVEQNISSYANVTNDQTMSSSISRDEKRGLDTSNEFVAKLHNSASYEEFSSSNIHATDSNNIHEDFQIKEESNQVKFPMTTVDFDIGDKFVTDMVTRGDELQLYGETHASFLSEEDFFNGTFNILQIVHYMAANYGREVLDIESYSKNFRYA